MTWALSIRNVSLRYAREAPYVLRNITLEVAPGERVAMLGLNGSGKTTLLHAIVGLLPFEGKIAVCGTQLTQGTARHIRDRIGFLFGTPDDQILFPNVLDDVAFTLERRGIPREEARSKARQIMDQFGIAHLATQTPHRLSHGQVQRVALAGALIADPQLLLLDEPSAALDPVGREETAGLLASMKSAMLIVTHDLAFARATCNRFVMLVNGILSEDSHDPDRIERYWCRRASNATVGDR